ncbi:MAG: 7-carboxy-7-deazaguanine synthase QueE [Euryarchaeota archaeon]|nr:7-carboxy-7-deazaguanine synthase QueE [Euryarchaeota archaeon]
MKSGYITEMFSSFQGEGAYTGRRQIFIRFAGCPLSCFYCDTSYARDSRPDFCTVLDETDFDDTSPRKPRVIENPVTAQHVIELVETLKTPDVHSICYTGGEPLLSTAFVKEIAQEAKKRHMNNFIETSGCSASAFASLAEYFAFAAIDIKLRHHRAVGDSNYERLYENELGCVKSSVDRGIDTIVKVVVLKGTSVDEIEAICRDLTGFDLKFVLQPVSAPRNLPEVAPGIKELFTLSEVAGRFLQDVMVIPQVHKFMGIL